MVNRKPVVAGQFYESDFGQLANEITGCFTNKLGPGDLPVRRGDKKIFGVVSPHAGYTYSGPCAAWSHKEIAESEFPELFVIIGPNHTGEGPDFSTYLFSEWETPIGLVKVDAESGKKLIKSFPKLQNEAMAHLYEHSIEVQLPFLQFVNKDRLNDIRFLPIVIKNYDYESCAALADAICELNKRFVVIASSDFTHYGPNYGYVPFVTSKKDNLYALDGGAIGFINELDMRGFLEYVKKKKATICGAGAIAVAMGVVKWLGAKEGKLLNYYTSGDIVGDYENAVGYAGIVFE